MKVAILSAVPMCGKTSFMELFAGVFTISQGRTAALFSTGDLSDLVASVEVNDAMAKAQPDIVKAMITTAPHEKSLLDYGTRIGMENVYLYDILGANMDEYDKIELLKKALDAIPVDLTLVELTGDLNSELNQEIIKCVDCSLYLVYPCWKAINNYDRILKALPRCPGTLNYKIVSAMIDPNSIGDKKFAKMLGLTIPDIIRYPEVDKVPKEAMVAHLDTVCQKIVNGDNDYVTFRQPFQEAMQYIFDSGNYKIIRDIEKWYK